MVHFQLIRFDRKSVKLEPKYFEMLSKIELTQYDIKVNHFSILVFIYPKRVHDKIQGSSGTSDKYIIQGVPQKFTLFSWARLLIFRLGLVRLDLRWSKSISNLT